MRICLAIVFCLQFLSCAWGQSVSHKEQAVAESHFDPFSPPKYIELVNGEKIFYSYQAALVDAQENSKLCILVYYNPFGRDVWEDIYRRDITIPADIGAACNIVVLQPGLVKPTEYFPKIDPMVFYISDFQERFSDLQLNNPAIILIGVDNNGQDYVQGITHVFCPLPCE